MPTGQTVAMAGRGTRGRVLLWAGVALVVALAIAPVVYWEVSQRRMLRRAGFPRPRASRLG